MKRSVLIVDDEPMLAAALARVLAKKCTVVVSNSAEAALERFESGERFDAVVADMMLGNGMDGVELMNRVAALDAQQASRFVFMTGRLLSDEDLSQFSVPVLVKPFTVEALMKLITCGSPHGAGPADPNNSRHAERRRGRASVRAKL